MNQQQKVRRLAERIESRSQQRGIDVLEAADEVMAGGDHSAFDYYPAARIVQKRRASESGAWKGVLLEERMRRLAASEGISEREAFDRLAPASRAGVSERDLAAQQAKIRALSEDEVITEAEAERRLFDQGVIR